MSSLKVNNIWLGTPLCIATRIYSHTQIECVGGPRKWPGYIHPGLMCTLSLISEDVRSAIANFPKPTKLALQGCLPEDVLHHNT